MPIFVCYTICMDKTNKSVGIILVLILVGIAAAYFYFKNQGVVTTLPQQSSGVNYVANTSWTLTSLTVNGQVVTLPSGSTTAQFSTNQITGATPCNTYSAPYTIKGMEIGFGTITVSSTACDASVAPFVQSYLTALSQITSFKLINDATTTLTLYSPQRNNTTITYTAAQ